MSMNPVRIAFVVLTCCAAIAVDAPVRAHEGAGGHDHGAPTKAAAKPATDPAHDAMMAEMMKNATPGAEHKELASMVGTWKANLKSWSAPGPPDESVGTMVNTMILGGRVLEGHFTGTFAGAPMTGVSLMGYDNAKKQYWSFWIDDMSTTTMMQTGAAAKDQGIVLTGTMDGMDGKPMVCTSKMKMVDANKHVYTMSSQMGGQDVPMMEITYSR